MTGGNVTVDEPSGNVRVEVGYLIAENLVVHLAGLIVTCEGR